MKTFKKAVLWTCAALCAAVVVSMPVVITCVDQVVPDHLKMHNNPATCATGLMTTILAFIGSGSAAAKACEK